MCPGKRERIQSERISSDDFNPRGKSILERKSDALKEYPEGTRRPQTNEFFRRWGGGNPAGRQVGTGESGPMVYGKNHGRGYTEEPRTKQKDLRAGEKKGKELMTVTQKFLEWNWRIKGKELVKSGERRIRT